LFEEEELLREEEEAYYEAQEEAAKAASATLSLKVRWLLSWECRFFELFGPHRVRLMFAFSLVF